MRRQARAPAFPALRNAFRGRRGEWEQLSQARNSVAVSRFTELIHWIRINPAYARRVFHPEYPRTFDLLENTAALGVTTPSREVAWAVAYLLPHAARLQAFLRFSEELQRAYLWQKADALSILESIEREFGVSLWLIKHRIAALQMVDGLQAQKAYAESVRSQSGNLPAFVAFHVSARNEPSVRPSRFSVEIDEVLASAGISPSVSAYVKYHISPDRAMGRQVVADVLRYEHAGPIVDYYEAFASLVPYLLSSVTDEEREDVLQALGTLSDSIRDSRLSIPCAASGAARPAPIASTHSIQAAEALLSADYVRARDLLLEAVALEPGDAAAFCLLTRPPAMQLTTRDQASSPLYLHLAQCVSAIASRSPVNGDDASDLSRHALNFFETPWARALLAVVEDETVDVVEPGNSSALSVCALSGPALHPFMAGALPPGARRMGYARALSEAGSELTNYALALTGTTSASSGTSEEWELLRARVAYVNRDYGSALLSASILVGSVHSFYRRRGARITTNSLLRLNRVEEAIQELTTAHLIHKVPHEMLPLRAAVLSWTEDMGRVSVGEVSVPVLLDLHMQYISNSVDTERVFAYQEFLRAHDLRRPSELGGCVERFDREKLIHFLRYVCVESVMDRCETFTSSRAVIEERLAVCRLLVDLDHDNLAAHQTEIKALVRRLMIQQGLHEIEQSKIYVDVDGLKRNASDELRDTYRRYGMLRQARPSPEGRQEVRSAIIKAEHGDTAELANLRLPINEATDVFIKFVQRLRDEYVSSPEHGLDKYLSVRIRHGTLVAHLRRRLDVAHLVTAKEPGTQAYKRNDFWLSHLGHAQAEVVESLARRLNRFSGEFDALVNEIKTWIQIRKDGPGPGMFEFVLSEPRLRILTEFITPERPFEEAVQLVIEQLGVVLDANLEKIRRRIGTEAKMRASALLDGLARDLERYRPWVDPGEICNVIRNANVDLRVDFERVSTWFRRTPATGNQPFSVSQAIDIAMESVRQRGAQEFDADVDAAVTEDFVLAGRIELTLLVDIFFIVFDNVVKHSDLLRPKLKISVRLGDSSDAEQYMNVSVVSDVSPRIVAAADPRRLEALRVALRDEQQAVAVSREGGTGFHKLHRILAHDLGGKPNLNFDYGEGDTFFVTFAIRFDKFRHEQNGSGST